ncbi:MAG: diguanylate cyclase [Spirochaetales bacterium]|nr:diguanylate cyclase [Spirochaetales bacterium]
MALSMVLAASLSLAVFFILFILEACSKREFHLILFALGFGAGTLGFMLLTDQAGLPVWLGLLVANVLIFFFHIAMSWGLRSWAGLGRSWIVRYTVLLAVATVALIAGILLQNLVWRVTAMSGGIILVMLGVLRDLRLRQRPVSTSIVVAVRILVGATILFHAIRISQAVGFLGLSSTYNPFSEFSATLILILTMLWGGILLIADADALYLELRRSHVQMAKNATTDALTGISNRRALEDRALYEIKRAERYDSPLCGILIDIDHFKVINDELGHLSGDEVLKEVCAAISSSLRSTDQLFRWGGEEFFVIAPETPQTGAQNLAEKIRRRVESIVSSCQRPLTVSLGVALWERQEDLPLWLERADKALYLAKNRGRNRVALDNPPRSSWLENTIQWHSEWNSGNAVIDEEHRQLIANADVIRTLAAQDGTQGQIAHLLEQITQEIKLHFQHEEGIMRVKAYPELPQHAEAHRRLLLKSDEVIQGLKSGQLGPLEAYTFLMSELLIGHILTVDTRFFPYLQL